MVPHGRVFPGTSSKGNRANTVPSRTRRCRSPYRTGQVTIEAAICLPVFLMVLLTLSSLIRYPLVCHVVDRAMADAARMMSMAAYPAHLTGALQARVGLEKLESEGEVIGKPLLEKVTGFLNLLGLPEQENAFAKSVIDMYGRTSRMLTSEAGRLANGWTDEALDRMVSDLVTWRLGSMQAEEDKASRKTASDPWAILGVEGGRTGVDTSLSEYDAATGKLLLVACYRLKPPAPFGLAPAVRCRSRVQIRVWGAGQGKAIRKAFGEGGASGDDPWGNGMDSLWNHVNSALPSWNRGLEIEKRELERLEQQVRTSGDLFLTSSLGVSGCDALSGGKEEGRVTAWEVFSLNPSLASYQENPSAVRRVIREHLAEMPGMGEKMKWLDEEGERVLFLRRLILVVPENAPEWVDEMAAGMMTELAVDGALLQVVRGYGMYREPVAPAATEGSQTGS